MRCLFKGEGGAYCLHVVRPYVCPSSLEAFIKHCLLTISCLFLISPSVCAS